MGEFFGAILRSDSNIQKKGTELFIKLVEAVEVVSSKYFEAIRSWREKDYERGYLLRDEIIELEKSADKVKDVFFDNIFRKKAYLPQITEERHRMMINADKIIDSIERAVRTLCLKKIDEDYFPPEFDEILEKSEKVIELFVVANKHFFKDYEKCAKTANELEDVRDEVRDLYFKVMEYVVNDKVPRGTKRVLDATVRLSIQSEQAVDYLKVLIAKHS